MSKITIEFEPQDYLAELVKESLKSTEEIKDTSDDLAIFTEAVVKLLVKEFNINIDEDSDVKGEVSA